MCIVCTICIYTDAQLLNVCMTKHEISLKLYIAKLEFGQQNLNLPNIKARSEVSAS